MILALPKIDLYCYAAVSDAVSFWWAPMEHFNKGAEQGNLAIPLTEWKILRKEDQDTSEKNNIWVQNTH